MGGTLSSSFVSSVVSSDPVSALALTSTDTLPSADSEVAVDSVPESVVSAVVSVSFALAAFGSDDSAVAEESAVESVLLLASVVSAVAEESEVVGVVSALASVLLVPVVESEVAVESAVLLLVSDEASVVLAVVSCNLLAVVV